MRKSTFVSGVYESAACRVWTGDRSTSLERIFDADEAELDVVRRCIRVHVQREQPRSGVYVLAQPHSCSSSSKVSSVSVLLPSASFRSFAVYSSSPFSSSVLVLLDVGTNLQQCFFFGAVQRCSVDHGHISATGDSSSNSSWRCGSDPEAATQLLADLHTAFPDVPLASSARDLLSQAALDRAARLQQQQQQQSSSLARPGATIAKRRRTLSASNFYGSRSPLAADSTVSATRSIDSSAWRSFYTALQFRVSHSQLCQLEGTAAVSSVFPRQLEAFEFADQVVAFRRRMRESDGNGITANTDSKDTPRVLSFEDAREGKRRFLVTSFDCFWHDYVHSTPASQRHVYEIIREGVPCRLYFDLEFKIECNADVDGEQLIARLISLVQLQFFRKYRIHVRREHVVQLDSSTPTKFSRHLIIHLPNRELFVDNIHAGNFVRELIHELVENASASDDEHSPFLVFTGRQQQPSATPVDANSRDASLPLPQQQLFIDTGVYTRNRMFRVLGSSKFRRDAVLRHLPLGSPSTSTQSSLPPLPPHLSDDDRDLFLQTLVCPYATREAFDTAPDAQSIRLLQCDADATSLDRSNGARPLWAPLASGTNTSNNSSRRRVATAHTVELRSSMFPALDAFVRANATKGGVQGEIRVVQALYDDVAVRLPGETDVSTSAQTSPLPTRVPWMLVYQLARNRWCANVQRAHRSNNVMVVVDLDQRIYYQKCHDERCRAIDYRSAPVPLPPDVVPTTRFTQAP